MVAGTMYRPTHCHPADLFAVLSLHNISPKNKLIDEKLIEKKKKIDDCTLA